MNGSEWTPEMLRESFERDYAGQVQVHTPHVGPAASLQPRRHHCGELSQTLGIHRLPQIDLWRPD